jgi:hypothetical protein
MSADLQPLVTNSNMLLSPAERAPDDQIPLLADCSNGESPLREASFSIKMGALVLMGTLLAQPVASRYLDLDSKQPTGPCAVTADPICSCRPAQRPTSRQDAPSGNRESRTAESQLALASRREDAEAETPQDS